MELERFNKRSRKSPTPTESSRGTSVGTSVDDCNLRVGMRVCGFWSDNDSDPDGPGQWYEGIVEGIDYVERTVNTLYEDGDRDDSVPWAKVRILDDIPDSESDD